MFSTITMLGNEIRLYDFFNTVGNLLMFLLCVFTLKECRRISTLPDLIQSRMKNGKGSSFLSWIITFLEIIVIFVPIFLLSMPIAHLISLVFMGSKDDNYFFSIFVSPYLLILVGIIFRFSPLELTDYATLPHIIALIFYKIACFCCGCCYGVACEKFGLYNHYNERMEFPIQLVELFCAVLMFIIILIVRRKKDRTPGFLYPLFIMMYCGSRFISEFWRDDYPVVAGFLRAYQIQCLIGFVEGLIFMIVVLKYGNRITDNFHKKKEALINKANKHKSEE